MIAIVAHAEDVSRGYGDVESVVVVRHYAVDIRLVEEFSVEPYFAVYDLKVVALNGYNALDERFVRAVRKAH